MAWCSCGRDGCSWRGDEACLGGGSWGSAGGHLEFGETLEDCARREAREEFGVEVGELRYLCVSNIMAYGRHYLDVEFLGDIGEPGTSADGAGRL